MVMATVDRGHARAPLKVRRCCMIYFPANSARKDLAQVIVVRRAFLGYRGRSRHMFVFVIV